MTQKDNILQELRGLNSTLADHASKNVYAVPEGYFEGLAAQVLNRIKATEAGNAIDELDHLSPTLAGISKQMPYAVPSNYFEGLAERVLSFIQTNDQQTVKEELDSISPLLSGLKKQNPYTVPQGYFETLPRKVVAEEGKPVRRTLRVAKVISLTHRKWFRYAAAAVIAGLIFMGGFISSGAEKEPGGIALAKFTRDIKKMNDVQKEDLIDFIDPDINTGDVAQVNTAEVKTLLQGISEEELNDFNEQTEDIEDVLMTN